MPLGTPPGKADGTQRPTSQETGHARKPTPVGCDGKETDMTTQTQSLSRADTGLAGIVLALAAGALLLVVSGHAQATILHDAAHDQRHAMAFPCH